MEKWLEDTYFWNETFKMHYHFTTSKDEFIKILKEYNTEADLSKNAGKCMWLSSDEEVMCIGVFDTNLSTLIHECVHAALFTFDAIGQELHYHDEALPYLVDWIFNECYKRHKQNNLTSKTFMDKSRKPIARIDPKTFAVTKYPAIVNVVVDGFVPNKVREAIKRKSLYKKHLWVLDKDIKNTISKIKGNPDWNLKSRKKLPIATKSDFEKLVKDGMSLLDISKHFNCHERTVRRWFREYKLAIPKRQNTPPKISKNDLENCIKDNMSLFDISIHFKCLNASVYYYLKKYGLTIPKKEK
jgi:transposase